MVEILRLEQRYEVDLHGLSEAEARAMVLCSLLSLQSSYKEGQPIESDLVIITGGTLTGNMNVACLIHDNKGQR